MIEKILIKKSIFEIKKMRIILLLPFTIFIIFNNLSFDNILKIFGTIIVLLLMFKYIFSENDYTIFIYSIISYLMIVLGELSFASIISITDYLFHSSIAINVSKAIYSNILIMIFSCIYSFLFRNKISYYINKINKSRIFITSLQIFITLIVVVSTLNILYFENWQFSYKFILVIIIMVGSLVLTFTLFKQYLKNKEVNEKYNILQDYLKTSANLIEKYSSTVHKYKNNLIIIKGYLKSDYNEANKYIDGLLDKMENRKYTWVKQINYIPNDTIRYMIYYKLSKAEENNLKIFVNVSKEIKKIEKKVLNSSEIAHLLNILGEYFDNAIYASNQSTEKEINFDLYCTNDKLYFIISNTFNGQIDINLITKNGYTTKGKGHGLGLYDIDKTIKSIYYLKNKYEIIDNYFVATLIVKLI